MRRTVVNARGQVTIPAELRKSLEIKLGTRVTWREEQVGSRWSRWLCGD
jgi:AbrB family looped-hinge helix DNA binding protein